MEPDKSLDTITPESDPAEVICGTVPESPAEDDQQQTVPQPPSRLRRFWDALCRAAENPVNTMRASFLLGPIVAYLMVEYLN